MKDNSSIFVYFNENEESVKKYANIIADFLEINRLNNSNNQSNWVESF